MAVEYKIRFAVPKDYDPTGFFPRLPSPISRPQMKEIYNFRVDFDGFYFVDRLVDSKVAALALRLFLDEALSQSGSIVVEKL